MTLLFVEYLDGVLTGVSFMERVLAYVIPVASDGRFLGSSLLFNGIRVRPTGSC